MRRQLVSWGVLAVLIGVAPPARGAEPAAAPTGFRAEFIAEVDAYARVNGVAPPWSEGAEPPAKKS